MTTQTNTPTASGFVYTDAMLQRMRDVSPIDNEMAEKLAEEFGFSVASVRAKAVRTEGVDYQRKAKTTKDGKPVESKSDLVEEIAEALGSDAESFESLGNATKLVLQKLRDALA